MKMNKYYRIVYFKNNVFYKIEVTDDETKIKRLIYTLTPNIEIYRCNSKGNNYTHRKVYPPTY